MADHATPTGRFGFLSNHYVKVYLVLLVLLAVSIIGPTFEILLVTLVTAFGVAVIKAWLVIKHFMHLTIERVVPKLFLAASVLLLALFWGGVAPDVQLHEGKLWENDAAKEAVARGIPEDDHGEDDHAEDAEHADDNLAVEVASAGLVPTSKPNDSFLPGGYNLVHGAFWTVVVLVAVGTNAVAIILSIGLVLMIVEMLSRVPILQRIMEPVLERLLRLPGVRRLRRFLPASR